MKIDGKDEQILEIFDTRFGVFRIGSRFCVAQDEAEACDSEKSWEILKASRGFEDETSV